MREKLWVPTEERIKNANVTKFIEFVNKNKYSGVQIGDYWNLYEWSIEDPKGFWGAMWSFCKVKA
ncbi:MAG: hypothetical protein ABIM21_00765, partial [candidate division WOR-3 bacterium]